MPSEAQKKASAKWTKENMATLACKVKKDYAEKVKDYAEANGETVNSYIRRLIDQDMQKDTPDH